MEILSKDDTYSVEYGSLISNLDCSLVLDLYMPIIGYEATIIYFILENEAKKNTVFKEKSLYDLTILSGLSLGSFAQNKEKLEAIGLIQTLKKHQQNNNAFIFYVYAPKDPKDFFDDVLLTGLLENKIGKRQIQIIKKYYQKSKLLDNDYVNTSAHFGEVFKPNYVRDFQTGIIKDDLFSHKNNNIELAFDYDEFIQNIVNNSQISKTIFTKDILKEIKRLANLYGMNEQTCARYVIECFNPLSEEKINFEKLNRLFQKNIKFPIFYENNKTDNLEKNLISSNSKLAQKINLMETLSCKDFLTILQNNVNPVQSDLNLIDDLSRNLQLRPCVINALIDYTLQKNGNVLSRAYVEKVGASLKRERIETAYDAMIFLLESNKKTKKKKQYNGNKEIKISGEIINSNLPQTNNNENDDILKKQWTELMKEFDKGETNNE